MVRAFDQREDQSNVFLQNKNLIESTVFYKQLFKSACKSWGRAFDEEFGEASGEELLTTTVSLSKSFYGLRSFKSMSCLYTTYPHTKVEKS